jgi:hypothetical protein
MKTKTDRFIFVLFNTLLSAVAPCYLYAQSEIETDRPDQAENTHVISPKEIQFETGFMLNRLEHQNEYIGSGLLRYGLKGNAELRLLIEDGKGRDTYIEETAQANYPLALSGKLALLKDQKLLPDITLIGYVKLPFTSHTSQQAKYWSPACIFAFQNKASEKFEINYSAGIKWDSFDPQHVYTGNVSLQFKIFQKVQFFTEYFGQYQKGDRPSHNTDAGILVLLTDNMQLDFSAGASIFSAQHPDHFLSVGFSFRLHD